MTRPDFIVIGAGSAGCVVARVLAERGWSVVLVEAGEKTPVCRTPALYPQAFGSSEDWNYASVPQPHLANRRIPLPRGRGPGGSTRINAMIWYPPPMFDLEALACAGGGDWSVERLTHSLEQIEQWVRPEHPRWLSEAARRFVRTAGNKFASQPFRRMARHGQRFTAADLLAESNASARVHTVAATASRIRFDGARASGVELTISGRSQAELIEANLGVVLCGGAIGSPLLLIRSGIGPAAFLADKRATAEPMLASEEVGSNLSDHLIMPVVYALSPQQRFPSAADCASLARFRIAATGPLASNLAEAGGVFSRPSLAGPPTSPSQRATPRAAAPWAQIHFTPTHYLLYPHHTAPAAMTIGVNLCHPRSRGSLRLQPAESSKSGCELEIDPGYLSEPHDQAELLHAIRFARELARQEPLASFHKEELVPGGKRDSDDALLRSIARYAQTLYHPTGTCRMGLDARSVVDQRLAVRGIRGLHIVDASVLPTSPSVNPNALVMMLAWHAAQWIAESAL